VKKLTSLAAALLAVSLSYSANAVTCPQLTPALFQDFQSSLLNAKTLGEAANVASAPYATPQMGTQAFNESSMNSLILRWNYMNDEYQLTGTPTLSYERLAPWLAAQFGYELNWNIAHVRYWASIHQFYNRPSSPFANAIVPAQNALNAVNVLHAKAEAINTAVTDCMKDQAW
jgi:hypothetical protein